MENDRSPFVTVAHGMRGWYAVIMWWNPELDGFWEPWATSPAAFPTQPEAIEDGRVWAEAEGVAFMEGLV